MLGRGGIDWMLGRCWEDAGRCWEDALIFANLSVERIGWRWSE